MTPNESRLRIKKALIMRALNLTIAPVSVKIPTPSPGVMTRSEFSIFQVRFGSSFQKQLSALHQATEITSLLANVEWYAFC